MIEVHSVDACDEGEGDEESGDHGKHFHDLVHSLGDVRLIDVEHSRGDIAEVFDRVDRLDGVVVDVVDIQLGRFLN